MKKSFVLIALFSITCTSYGKYNHNEIIQEFKDIRKTEYQFKKNISKTTQSLLRGIDQSSYLANQPCWKFLFYQGFVCQWFELVMITEERAPRTYALVKEIAEEINVPMPILYVKRDESYCEVDMCGYLPSVSLLMFGDEFIKTTTLEELRFAIAHNLAQIKAWTFSKHIGLRIASLGAFVYLLKKLGMPLTETITSESGSRHTTINIFPLITKVFFTELSAELISSAHLNSSVYSADRCAAKAVGTEAGMSFMKYLKKHHEPNYDQDFEELGQRHAGMTLKNNPVIRMCYLFEELILNSPFSIYPTADQRIAALETTTSQEESTPAN